MRRFIIISNTVDTSKPLLLNSLTSYGRLDVLCRCISSAFFLSNNFRKEVILEIFFQINEQILEIVGELVQGLNPDERAIAGVLKRIFSGKSYPGAFLKPGSLKQVIEKYPLVMVTEDGKQSFEILKNYNSFLIGDHIGFLEEFNSLFNNLEKISLGKKMYLSSQTITIIHYHLDTLNIN